MANDTNTIWIDSSFSPPLEGKEDVTIKYSTGYNDNIGDYSVPVVYTQKETIRDYQNINTEYFQKNTSISGATSTALYFHMPLVPFNSGILTSLIEYNTGDTTISGSNELNIEYSTGYNSIPGALNKKVAYTIGRNTSYTYSIYTYFMNYMSISSTMDYWCNYTNFSGNLTTSGTAIPYYYDYIDFINQYDTGLGYKISTLMDKVVDITFAGWVPFEFGTDIFSSYMNLMAFSEFDITTISGNVYPIYADLYSTSLYTKVINNDIYCSEIKLKNINFDADIRDGRIVEIDGDIYSSTQNLKNVKMDVDLYPLKITNFFPAEESYTAASSFISVDIVDDTCQVSVSGTYLTVNEQKVSTYLSPIKDGYRMYYDPLDDFLSLDGPTTFTVHAESECGNQIEENYYLTFGYLVEYNSYYNSDINFGNNTKVLVRITAEDYATCPTVNSLAWEFKTLELKNNNLGASITGIPVRSENRSLSGQIKPLSTAYFYNKKFKLVVTAKDFNGNEMDPFILNYTIEDK